MTSPGPALRRRLPTRYYRIAIQALTFALWAGLIALTRHPIDAAIAQVIPVSWLLRLDPLVMTVVCGSMRVGISILLVGAITFAVTVVLGRVFCGWACPLGTIFDFYGWFLNRLGIKAFGPSPRWFRAKYYLLFAILLFAVFGVTNPLMGFDPIVLLTRVAATVVGPVVRAAEPAYAWGGREIAYHGGLFDLATLILFAVIMGATTRLTRIWCRTACPLGAYLAVSSRYSALRRETRDCVQCGICVQACPTGAIDAKDATRYNESECVKCFTCSEVCPVDANFFALRSPVDLAAALRRNASEAVQLDRRAVLATAAATVAATPLLTLASGDPGASKRLIRPPMSREEPDFLSSCIRCGECMKACPSGILKPAGLEHGLRALWSPVMVASEGACQSGCNACSVACPTDAIMKYPIERKYDYKAGTATLDTSRCVSYGENQFCSECVKACPTNAIAVAPGWKPASGMGSDERAPAGETPQRPISVHFGACIGCGACELECNRIVTGTPAIQLTAFGRAAKSSVETPR